MSADQVAEQPRPFWLYLLECDDGTLYTGIARDPVERFLRHCAGAGAAYTRSHPPVRILAVRELSSQSEALKAEYALKQLPRRLKLGHFSASERCIGMPAAEGGQGEAPQRHVERPRPG